MLTEHLPASLWADIATSLNQQPPQSLLGRKLTLITPQGIKTLTVTSQTPYSYGLECDLTGYTCSLPKATLRAMLQQANA
jgi:hypothetical protein